MVREHPDWEPARLRQHRERHGLTLEEAGSRLREVGERYDLNVAANFQTLWNHESGSARPTPHYRRAYCLLYAATEPELGFRSALPGEVERSAAVDPESAGPIDELLAAALGGIAAGDGQVDADHLRGNVLDAWRHRRGTGGPAAPTLVLVGGYAGSGKTELSRFLSSLTRWPMLDKDSLTRPLVERLLTSLGLEADDRHSPAYMETVRPLEYRCLMEAAWENLDCGISTVVTAPFIGEFADEAWLTRTGNRCLAGGFSLAPVWIKCDVDSMREYLEFRDARRDTWKLNTWAEYLAMIDLDFRPRGPHLLVDNQHGTAVALADRARAVIKSGRQ